MFFDVAKRIALRSRASERLRRWGGVLAGVIVIIGGLDVVSTNVALAAGQIEANPLVRWLQADMGTWWSLPKMAELYPKVGDGVRSATSIWGSTRRF